MERSLGASQSSRSGSSDYQRSKDRREKMRRIKNDNNDEIEALE
jgi:hypothetical protein